MRVKTIISLVLGLLSFLLSHQSVFAVAACLGTSCTACSGPCGVQSCTYSATLPGNGGNCPDKIVNGQSISQCATYTCFDEAENCQVPSGDPHAWCPGGHPNVACNKIACDNCDQTGNCIYETWDNVLCNCAPTATPTPNPTGGGGGTGTPTPSASPTPTTSLIQGSIHLDTDASLSGNFCAQSTPSPLALTGNIVLRATKDGIHNHATFGFANPHLYSINTAQTGGGYTVLLNLTNQSDTNYVCSCPAPFNPEDPYRCRYTGVTSPSAAVNFYLKDRDLANDSWFQIFGSNLFATGLISSPVPASHCDGSPNCQTALTAPSVQTSTLRSSGFPISASGNATSIRSSTNASTYHSYLHLPTRPANLNSYALNTALATLSYDYFYKLAENQLTEIGTGEDLEPSVVE